MYFDAFIYKIAILIEPVLLYYNAQMSEFEAKMIMDEFMTQISQWEDHYKSCGVSDQEIALLKNVIMN